MLLCALTMRPVAALAVMLAAGHAALCVRAAPHGSPGAGPAAAVSAGPSSSGDGRLSLPEAPSVLQVAAPPGGPQRGGAVTAPAPPSPSLVAIEEELIALVNREREGRGLGALVPDAHLTAAARGHSREMCDLAYFDHRSPTEGLYTPLDRFRRALAEGGAPEPPNLLLGENIYHISELNHVYNVAFGHRAIMASPSHRAAILEPRYTRIGVGAHRDARGELWATEMFLRDTPWAPDGRGATIGWP